MVDLGPHAEVRAQAAVDAAQAEAGRRGGGAAVRSPGAGTTAKGQGNPYA